MKVPAMGVISTVLITAATVAIPVAWALPATDPVSPLLTCKSWILFAPPSPFNPTQNQFPSEAQLSTALKLLYDEGWRGLVTYSMDGTLREVPRIAKEVGFARVIAGIYWDQAGQQRVRETAAAIEEKAFVDGFVLGNEGIQSGWYTRADVEREIALLKNATGLLVTTSEPPGPYTADPLLLQVGDWVFPNVQPWFAPTRNVPAAVAFVVNKVAELQLLAPGRPIIVKEAWWPTGGGDPAATEANQTEFFRQLSATTVPFVWGEAFDQFWKTGEGSQGPFWGLHSSGQAPKPIVQDLRSLFDVTCPALRQAFHTVEPCRLVDTRLPNAPLGGPALSATSSRSFPTTAACGVSSSAHALSLNVTVTQATDPGNLRLSGAGADKPPTSTINYGLGQTRANNAIVAVNPSGLTVWCDQGLGTVHVIVDVNGFFE